MWVKITIFKTFVRPITSYGMAPMALWLDQQPVGRRSKLYNLLDALHLDSLQWILGDKAKNTPRGILESITALPNPARLMGEAAATFNRQLTQLPPDHLWRQVARKYLPHGPWPVTALLPRLQAPQQLVLQYEQCCRDAAAAAPPLPTPSWTPWLQQNRIQELQEPTTPSRGQTTGYRPLGKLRHRSVLCNYIAPAARQARAGFDRILLAEPFSLARTAINWRLNRFSPSLRCINCQKPFTRAHISRCNTLDPNPRFQTFKAMAEARSAALQSTGFKVGALNAMDEMLNQRDYGSFLAAWELSTTTSKPGAQQQPQNSIAASLRDPSGTPGPWDTQKTTDPPQRRLGTFTRTFQTHPFTKTSHRRPSWTLRTRPTDPKTPRAAGFLTLSPFGSDWQTAPQPARGAQIDPLNPLCTFTLYCRQKRRPRAEIHPLEPPFPTRRGFASIHPSIHPGDSIAWTLLLKCRCRQLLGMLWTLIFRRL